MALITPDRITEKTIGNLTIKIKERIIPDSARSNKYQADYVKSGDPVKPMAGLEGGKPLGICIHNTEDIEVPIGTTPAEQYSRAMWPNCNLRGVAVHFFVYHDDIWQNLSLTEQGWHSGDGSYKKASHRNGVMINGNLNTISIECIGASSESAETTARLTAYLLKEFGLSPETDIYTHNFFSPSKYCPLYLLPKWSEFENRIKEIFYAEDRTKETLPEEEKKERPVKTGDEVDFLGGYHFLNSNATSHAGGIQKEGRAIVTLMNPGAKHPFHLVHTKGSTSGVYGWVDESAIKKEFIPKSENTEANTEKIPEKEKEPVKIGDEVDFIGGYHYSNSNAGSPAGQIQKEGRATVTFMNPGARHPFHLVHTKESTSGVYGWVDENSIRK